MKFLALTIKKSWNSSLWVLTHAPPCVYTVTYPRTIEKGILVGQTHSSNVGCINASILLGPRYRYRWAILFRLHWKIKIIFTQYRLMPRKSSFTNMLRIKSTLDYMFSMRRDRHFLNRNPCSNGNFYLLFLF